METEWHLSPHRYHQLPCIWISCQHYSYSYYFKLILTRSNCSCIYVFLPFLPSHACWLCSYDAVLLLLQEIEYNPTLSFESFSLSPFTFSFYSARMFFLILSQLKLVYMPSQDRTSPANKKNIVNDVTCGTVLFNTLPISSRVPIRRRGYPPTGQPSRPESA